MVLSLFPWLIILSVYGIIGLLGLEIADLLNDLAHVWEGGTRMPTRRPIFWA